MVQLKMPKVKLKRFLRLRFKSGLDWKLLEDMVGNWKGVGDQIKKPIFFKMQKWHRPIYDSLPLSFFLAMPQTKQREYRSLSCIILHTSHQTGQQTCLPYSLAFVLQPLTIKYKLCSPLNAAKACCPSNLFDKCTILPIQQEFNGG